MRIATAQFTETDESMAHHDLIVGPGDYRRLPLIVLVICATLLFGSRHRYSSGDEIGQSQRIQYLIDMLRSANDAPGKPGPIAQFPKTYDVRSQAVVYLACEQLLAEGSAGFGELIKHFDDNAYSYSERTPSGVRHISVGTACWRIMRRTIVCYEMEIPLVTFDQMSVMPWKGRTIQEWWKENSARSLWEIQAEAIKAQIEFQEALVYENAEPLLQRGERLAKAEFERLRAIAIQRLKQLHSIISETHDPFRPRTLDEHSRSMILPWPTRQF